jgi:hypothetical protein
MMDFIPFISCLLCCQFRNFSVVLVMILFPVCIAAACGQVFFPASFAAGHGFLSPARSSPWSSSGSALFLAARVWIFLPRYQVVPRFVSQLVTRVFSVLGTGLLICFSMTAKSFSRGFLGPIRQRRPGFGVQPLFLSFCDECCCPLGLVLYCAQGFTFVFH